MIGQYFAQALVALVGKEQRVAAQEHTGGAGELGSIGRGAIAAVRDGTTTRDRSDIAGRIYAANAMVKAVGNVHGAKGVDGDGGGEGQSRVSWQIAVARKAGVAGAGNCSKPAVAGRELADAVVVRIGDIDVAAAVYKESPWGVERRLGRGGVVDKKTGGGVLASNCCNDAGTIDTAYAIIAGIGDINNVAAHKNGRWCVEFGRRRLASVAGESAAVLAGERYNRTPAVDAAYAVVTGIGNIDNVVVREDAGGGIDGYGRGCAVAGKSRVAVAGMGCNGVAVGAYAANAVVARVGDIEHARYRIAPESRRQAQAGAGRRAAIARKALGTVAGEGGNSLRREWYAGGCGGKESR